MRKTIYMYTKKHLFTHALLSHFTRRSLSIFKMIPVNLFHIMLLLLFIHTVHIIRPISQVFIMLTHAFLCSLIAIDKKRNEMKSLFTQVKKTKQMLKNSLSMRLHYDQVSKTKIWTKKQKTIEEKRNSFWCKNIRLGSSQLH